MKFSFPESIISNLNPKLKLRPYQEESLACFEDYYKHHHDKDSPIHLLFNLATGAGKTLLMAANILYLYEKGYRNFIFFVNQTQIVEKTKDNFLNSFHLKYLFNKEILINYKKVNITSVNNFTYINENDINILFTTIQGLHISLDSPKENKITLEELENDPIVLLSDEAHHINVSTKKGSEPSEDERTWENTVDKILSLNDKNILLEYTATVASDDHNISKKYNDKLIYQYDLKSFNRDGYSKTIHLLKSHLEEKHRLLHTVIMSHYRKLLAGNYFTDETAFLKPVILVKSKTIKESEEHKKIFESLIENLSHQDIEAIKKIDHNFTKEILQFFENRKIDTNKLIASIKQEFNKEFNIIINTKSDENIDEKIKIVNSLEDQANPYRVIFVVEQLVEGWDVLNLYDIVRLGETSGTSHNNTIRDAQLIGRGARYFPIPYQDEDMHKRKFDLDVIDIKRKQLIGLERFYFHSINDVEYLKVLEEELEKMGLKPKQGDSKEINLKIKESFKQTKTYESGVILKNRRISRDKLNNLNEIFSLLGAQQNSFEFVLDDNKVMDVEIFKGKNEQAYKEKKAFRFSLYSNSGNGGSIASHKIISKAMDKLPYYRFNELQKILDNSSFKTMEQLYKDFAKIEVILHADEDRINDISKDDRLMITLKTLEKLQERIEKYVTKYEGIKKFDQEKINKIFTDKIFKVTSSRDPNGEGHSQRDSTDETLKIDLNLPENDWYVYNDNFGSMEEKALVKFIQSFLETLETNNYRDIYLIRNEQQLKLFNFKDGRGFCPDFILLLTKDNKIVYQCFIECKGDMLLEYDQWKLDFLQEINKIHDSKTGEREMFSYQQDMDFKLIGFKFYNKNNENKFTKDFKKKLSLSPSPCSPKGHCAGSYTASLAFLFTQGHCASSCTASLAFLFTQRALRWQLHC